MTTETFHLPGQHVQKSHGGDGKAVPDLTGEFEDAGLSPADAARAQAVIAAFQERYGVGIQGVFETPDGDEGLVARVRGPWLEVNAKLLNDEALEKLEADGFLAPGVGTVEGLMTHELGHVVLQGGGMPREAVIQANRATRERHGVIQGKVSTYSSRDWKEQEAELFAHYHLGGDRREPWVIGWGEALHEAWQVDEAPLTFAAERRLAPSPAAGEYSSPGFRVPPELLVSLGLTAAATRTLADVPPVPHHLTDAYLATAANRLAGAGDLLWEAARDQLREGTAAGESHARLAQRIRKATGLALPRAKVIARTEARDALLAGSLNQVRATGLTGTKTWIAVRRSKRTRPEHKHAHGQTVNLRDYFQVGGWPMDRPHDEVAPADLTVNCRCGLRYDLDTADVLLGPAPVRAKADERLLQQVWDAGLARKGVTQADLTRLLEDLGLTAATEPFHLPGGHDQQRHGRRFPDGGSAQPDLTDQLLLVGLNQATATRVQGALDDLAGRYGITIDQAMRDRIPGEIAAFTDTNGSRRLEINPDLLDDEFLAEEELAGELAPGVGSVEGIIAHEYGHLVLHRTTTSPAETDRIQKARQAADQAATAAGWGEELLSNYARQSHTEREAEWFGSYQHGGDRRPPWLLAWGDTISSLLSTALTSAATPANSQGRYRTPGFHPPGLDDSDASSRTEGSSHRQVFHPGHPTQKVHGRRNRRHLPSVKGGPKRYTRGSGTKDDPLVTNDAWAAADALADGKHVQLDSPEEVSTLLDRLHEIGVEAKAAGTKAKLYDLCKVSVARTNLFCAESKGVARVNMPQFRGHPRPGTPADRLEKLPDGKVDLSRPFIDHLTDSGVKVSDARVDASHLKASQRELDGVKVAGMMKAMQSGKLRVRDAFFVSSDNYVVDGHHLWAATVGREFSEGRTLYLDVQRIDAPILDVLDQANTFTADQGLPRAGITAALVARLQERTPVTVDDATAHRLYVTAARGHPQPADLTPDEARFFAAAVADLAQFHLPGGHNQKKHGRKIPGDGARARMGDIPLDEGRLKDFHGGSAMAHLMKGPDGSYRFTPERQALHDEIINKHLTGKTPAGGQPVYHVLGGGPAAGKSTYVDSDAGAGLRDQNTVMVNADDMKAELPEYQQMVADKNPTASSFVHEESSYLAARLQAASFENRLNVTLDGTGDSPPAKLLGKLAAARAAGYRVEGHYVTVPTDVAVERANARGAKTGRYVPQTVVRGIHSGVSRTLPEVYQEFDAVDLYDTRGSSLEHVMAWRDGSFTVHDSGLWDEFVAKGAS